MPRLRFLQGPVAKNRVYHEIVLNLRNLPETNPAATATDNTCPVPVSREDHYPLRPQRLHSQGRAQVKDKKRIIAR